MLRYDSPVSYIQPLYRPPSEADSIILQATLGCSWNHCTYCAMYRSKVFRVRTREELGQQLDALRLAHGPGARRLFVADGDALGMPFALWSWLLEAVAREFPRLVRISAYATARNVLEKSPAELSRLRDLGLRLLYLGPESGDDVTLGALAKGASFDDHVRASQRLAGAGIAQSLIFLLGAGGRRRSRQHAEASARLLTAMNPRHASLLTLTVLDGTPLALAQSRGRFEQASLRELLAEARTFVAGADVDSCVFRCNHASNHLELQGRLPRDRERLVAKLDAALASTLPPLAGAPHPP